MFTAIKANGQSISLAKWWSRERLVLIREQETFYCPGCLGEVILKLGNKKLWHFAHKPGIPCPIEAEAESQYHLLGKLLIYKWLKNQVNGVFLEMYLPQIKQRPDIFFFYQNKKFAVEFQCSIITVQDIKERTENYIREGICPIWIVGEKRLKNYAPHLVSLTAFEWSFFHNDHFVLYFCPQTKRFATLTNICSFSNQKTIANVSFTSLNQLTINQLIHPPPSDHFPLQQWFTLKRNWRIKTPLFIPEADHYVRRLIHEKGYYMPHLPSEAGLPLPSLYWIETPCVYWQSWIVIQFIFELKVGDMLTLDQIIKAFTYNVSKGIFQIRDLPFVKGSSFSHTIMEYMDLLTRLGILKKIAFKTYRKEKDIKVAGNMKEALQLDEQIRKEFNRALTFF